MRMLVRSSHHNYKSVDCDNLGSHTESGQRSCFNMLRVASADPAKPIKLYTLSRCGSIWYITVPSCAAIRSNEKSESYRFCMALSTYHIYVETRINVPLRIALRYFMMEPLAWWRVWKQFILGKIRTMAPRTATKEMNPDSATRVRPMVSHRVKQTILAPWVLLILLNHRMTWWLPAVSKSLCTKFKFGRGTSAMLRKSCKR